MGIHMDVNMPSGSIAKSKRVFYALVLGICCQSVAAAQQGDSRSGRQTFGGIVERLSQDDAGGQATQFRGGRPVEQTADIGRSEDVPSQRLRVAEDNVVALRPQPMSVRQTSYESAPVDQRF